VVMAVGPVVRGASPEPQRRERDRVFTQRARSRQGRRGGTRGSFTMACSEWTVAGDRGSERRGSTLDSAKVYVKVP